jgi:hypothetical protein
MYPNSALSAGQMALFAVVAILGLAFWITAVFVAAREPRRRGSAAGTTSLPERLPELQEHRPEAQEPHDKAA